MRIDHLRNFMQYLWFFQSLMYCKKLQWHYLMNYVQSQNTDITGNDHAFGCSIIKNSQCYLAHRHLNNAWHNNAYSLMGMLCLTIIASNATQVFLSQVITVKRMMTRDRASSLKHEYLSIDSFEFCVNFHSRRTGELNCSHSKYTYLVLGFITALVLIAVS